MPIQNENMTVFISSIKASLLASSEALKQMKSKYTSPTYNSPGFSLEDAILAIDFMLEYNNFFQEMLVQLRARHFDQSDIESRAYQYIYQIYLKKKQTLELENTYIQIFKLLNSIIENKDLNTMSRSLKFQGTCEKYIGISLTMLTYALTVAMFVSMTTLTLVLAELFAPYSLAVMALILLICLGQMNFRHSSAEQKEVASSIFFGTLVPAGAMLGKTPSYMAAEAGVSYLTLTLYFPAAIAIGIFSAIFIGKPLFFLGEEIEASAIDKEIQSERIFDALSSAEKWHKFNQRVSSVARRDFFFKSPKLQEDFEASFNLALTKLVPCV